MLMCFCIEGVLMTNFLTDLVCLKHALTRSQNPERRNRHQSFQSIHSVYPNDRIMNKIIQMFVDPGHDYDLGTYYSRAITGEPMCGFIQTDKESWLAAITRSVKLEWPGYDFSDKAILQRIRGMAKGINLGGIRQTYCGSVYHIPIYHIDMDEWMKMHSSEEYKILRHTECADILVFPLDGKVVGFKKGFRIQKEKAGLWKTRAVGEDCSYKRKVDSVFTPEILEKLWRVYLDVEKDPQLHDKIIKEEIHGEPGDKKNPAVCFHVSIYGKNFSSCHGGWAQIPGVEAVDSAGKIYKRETRLTIPTPENGARLPYKNELALPHSPLQLGCLKTRT